MKVEFGIMSNKWSVEAPTKLICYAAILIFLGSNGFNMVMLYNEECKDDQWAFSENTEKRLEEIFGEEFFSFVEKNTDKIKEAVKTIEKIV